MCGRYYRRSDKQKIAEAFHVSKVDDFALPPWDYNVAPHTMQPIIRESKDGERELVPMRWGLVPFSTKSLADLKGKSTINARGETLTRGWWAQPFKKRRCIVPLTGFYEWTHDGKKQPFAFDLANGHMMGIAGLWDAWKNPVDGRWLQTFTIITTEANELMAAVHNRMPVILHERQFARWLDRSETERLPLDLVRPLPSDEMEIKEANPAVGNVRNNGAEMLDSR